MLPLEMTVTPAKAIASLNVVVQPRNGSPEVLLFAHVYSIALSIQNVSKWTSFSSGNEHRFK